MGMFNWVAFTIDCPRCDEPISSFQTNDGIDDVMKMDVLLPHMVNEFSGSCDNCGVVVQFEGGKQTMPTWDNGMDDGYGRMAVDGRGFEDDCWKDPENMIDWPCPECGTIQGSLHKQCSAKGIHDGLGPTHREGGRKGAKLIAGRAILEADGRNLRRDEPE